MSSFNNLFRNLNLSKKSQLSPIFRTGGSILYKSFERNVALKRSVKCRLNYMFINDKYSGSEKILIYTLSNVCNLVFLINSCIKKRSLMFHYIFASINWRIKP